MLCVLIHARVCGDGAESGGGVVEDLKRGAADPAIEI